MTPNFLRSTTKTPKTPRIHQDLCVLGVLVVFCLLSLTLLECRVNHKRPQNVIVITIDTLRADALSAYGSKTPTAFLQRFSENAAVFERAFTSAPITLPAHTSLFTGLYPPSHGVRHNGVFKAQPSLTLLSELARSNGFETAAFVAAAPVSASYGLNQGFDIYDDSFAPARTEQGTFLYAERNAEQVRTAAQKWLLNRKSVKSFFLWLHFFDPHHPYQTHGYPGLKPYEEEVVYTDYQLGEFFTFLQQNKLDTENLVVITSDHGEAFGEHEEISHSLFVYNTTVHIPLMMSGPNIRSQRRVEVVRIVDIFPTITEIMGWKSSSKIDGVSLVPLLQDRKLQPLESYSESFASAIDFGWSPLASIQDAKFKYIHGPQPEMYDLKSDPAENHNLSSIKQIAAYKTKIELILNAEKTDSIYQQNPEELEKLRSLGYIAGAPQKISWDAPNPKQRVHVARRIAELTMESMPLEQKAGAYAEIVEMDPSNPLVLLRFGEILLQLKNYVEAERAFTQVIALHYPSAAPYNGLAAVYYYQERISDAEAILQKAVDTKVADGETYFNLAEFLYNRSQTQQALNYYSRSMQLGHKLAAQRKAQLLECKR